MSKRRLSGTGSGSGSSGGEKASRLSLSDGQLQALEAAFVGGSSQGLGGDLGEVRAPLTRFLDSVKGSIFMSLRAFLAAATMGGAGVMPSGSEGEVEPLDRDLAKEVEALEKEAEKLAKAVKETRESVRVGYREWFGCSQWCAMFDLRAILHNLAATAGKHLFTPLQITPRPLTTHMHLHTTHFAGTRGFTSSDTHALEHPIKKVD